MIKQILKYAKDQRATDIHICAGAPIFFRINGELNANANTKAILSPEQARDLTFELMDHNQVLNFQENLDYDFM